MRSRIIWIGALFIILILVITFIASINLNWWGFTPQEWQSMKPYIFAGVSAAITALAVLLANMLQNMNAQKLAQERGNLDREIAIDKQQADELQTYLDRMNELLLERDLRTADPNSDVRYIARARTLAVLRNLDPARRLIVVHFLQNSGLIQSGGGSLIKHANLSQVDLSKATLPGVDLSQADLRGANLSEADLRDANLFGADLRDANLLGADLERANLCAANLRGANLRKARLLFSNLSRAWLARADLREAYLQGENELYYKIHLDGADLRGANLLQANITRSRLKNSKLRGAMLPPDNDYRIVVVKKKQTSSSLDGITAHTLVPSETNNVPTPLATSSPDNSASPAQDKQDTKNDEKTVNSYNEANAEEKV